MDFQKLHKDLDEISESQYDVFNRLADIIEQAVKTCKLIGEDYFDEKKKFVEMVNKLADDVVGLRLSMPLPTEIEFAESKVQEKEQELVEENIKMSKDAIVEALSQIYPENTDLYEDLGILVSDIADCEKAENKEEFEKQKKDFVETIRAFADNVEKNLKYVCKCGCDCESC